MVANFLLCIYLIALEQRDLSFYEFLRRLTIILYITNMYINHIYLIKILRLLQSNKVIQFNIIYLPIFYIIIALMTMLIIIGLPWVNPLFKYPDQLKNIVEWNYFLLTIVFYIPLSLMFYQLSDKAKKWKSCLWVWYTHSVPAYTVTMKKLLGILVLSFFGGYEMYRIITCSCLICLSNSPSLCLNYDVYL